MLLSSLSVYSWGHLRLAKRLMREDGDIDQNHHGGGHRHGLRAQQMGDGKDRRHLAAERDGLPLMTFRLGHATCHSRTGAHADYQWWSRRRGPALEYRACRSCASCARA